MYWRDIPSMVTVKHRRERAKLMLPDRFQAAIDRAAMRAGKENSDWYLDEWRRQVTEIDSATFHSMSMHELVDKEVAVLDQGIPDELLNAMTKNKGFQP